MKSSCCQAPVKLNKPNAHRGETVFYICTKCNEMCDISSVYIKPDKVNPECLWLFIEKTEKEIDTDSVMGMFRDEDNADNVAYPILKNEVQDIITACREYLKRRNNETNYN